MEKNLDIMKLHGKRNYINFVSPLALPYIKVSLYIL